MVRKVRMSFYFSPVELPIWAEATLYQRLDEMESRRGSYGSRSHYQHIGFRIKQLRR